MAGKEKKLQITEAPVAAPAWKEGDGSTALTTGGSTALPSTSPGTGAAGRLGVIEQDLREMMRRLAEASFQVAEGERQHTEDTRKMLLSILEVADALDRVFRSIQSKEEQVTPQMKKWIGNFRTVRSLVEKLLTERGVVRIENLDQGFDPNWHKVAEIVVDTSRPEGTIVEEVLRGYLWRGRLLRKAEVKVVRHEEGTAEAVEE